MTNVIMTLMKFSVWLNKEMEIKGLSQNRLAKLAGVSQGAIAHVINGRRNPGPELCEGVARAFKIPPEDVFRIAGLLPPAREENPTDEELLYLYDQLSEEEQEEIRKWIRFKVEENKRKERE